MVIAIALLCVFVILLLFKVMHVEPSGDQDAEFRIKDQETAKEIIQALRDTQIIKEFETIDDQILQPYARRLWTTECPAEQIQIGLEVADVVSRHMEFVEVDPVLHRRSQFTVIVNRKIIQP